MGDIRTKVLKNHLSLLKKKSLSKKKLRKQKVGIGREEVQCSSPSGDKFFRNIIL